MTVCFALNAALVKTIPWLVDSIHRPLKTYRRFHRSVPLTQFQGRSNECNNTLLEITKKC